MRCKYCSRQIKFGSFCDYVCKENHDETQGKILHQKFKSGERELIYCIGRYCRGAKLFWSVNRKTNRLCPYCRRHTSDFYDAEEIGIPKSRGSRNG